jgi:hypothetical protein
MSQTSDNCGDLYTDLTRQFGDAVCGVAFRLARPKENVTAAYEVYLTRALTTAETAKFPAQHCGFPVAVDVTGPFHAHSPG